MKRILIFVLCAMLIFATPIVAFAEGEVEEVTEEVTTETEVAPVEEDKPITEVIVDYLKSNPEEVMVMLSLLLGAIYKIMERRKLTGSIGTLNNNAIAVAENSASAMGESREEMRNMTNEFRGCREEFASLLAEFRKTAEEKQSLEDTLNHVETFLKTAKLATLELSNEVAELLVLANIPNSKKEELYARHTKAVHDLQAVEEVMSNDGKET